MEVSVLSLVQFTVDRINKCVLGESMMVVENLINVGQKCPWDLKAKNAMNTVQLIAKMKKSCVLEVRTWMDARCLTCAIPNTHRDMEAMDKCVQLNVQLIVTMMKQCVLAELWMDVQNLNTVCQKSIQVQVVK